MFPRNHKPGQIPSGVRARERELSPKSPPGMALKQNKWTQAIDRVTFRVTQWAEKSESEHSCGFPVTV